MVLKNLFRRKGRTILTLVGIAIGVAAIVALGAMAKGLKAGFSAMSQSSQADLVISQSESLTSLISSVDESAAEDVRVLPGVAAVDGMHTQCCGTVRTCADRYELNSVGFVAQHKLAR